MNGGDQRSDKVVRALLCLNDADVHMAVKAPVFGQPFVFHLIKTLYAVGIDRIALSVESVAPELPAMIDRLRSEKLDILLLRSGGEALQFAAEPGPMLLQNAAIWIAPDSLIRLMGAERSIISTLPEDARFAAFERIDLNRRWAGVALIDGSIARGVGAMPEGWSIDSYLLRAALQTGCRDEPIAATNPAAIVMHSSLEDSHKRLAQRLIVTPSRRGWVDQSIAAITDRSMNRLAGTKWWDILVEWSWPLLSLCAVAAGYFGHIIVGLWLGSSALLARIVRERAREVTYRRSSGDIIDIISIILLVIAGAFALQASVSAFDALFLSLSLFGLTWVVLRNAATTLASQISPLTVTLLLAIFASFGQPAAGFKVAIMAIVAILCIGLFTKQS